MLTRSFVHIASCLDKRLVPQWLRAKKGQTRSRICGGNLLTLYLVESGGRPQGAIFRKIN